MKIFDDTMKVIAYYLPQFHETDQNNKWWGKGFTEWVNVKKAKPLYEGHYQPRIPLKKNYYDLLNPETLKWQIDIAKQYGLFGFCFYHYWFNNGDKLLEKPIEMFLEHKEWNMKFCLSWANEPWTKAWVSKSDQVLIGQNYGNEETWKKHFKYLLSFFQDERYIKEDNKPLFIIYRPEIIPCLNKMLDYMNNLAIENGFSGIKYAYQGIWFDKKKNKDDSRFDYDIEYEPGYGQDSMTSSAKKALVTIGKTIDALTMKLCKHKLSDLYLRKVRRLPYDMVWEAILSNNPKSKKRIAGAFVDWDNTPRRGNKGLVIDGANPEKFFIYMKRKIEQTKKYYSTNYIFLFAWNEWAEGGYMEPDEKYEYRYLEALKHALSETQNGKDNSYAFNV